MAKKKYVGIIYWNSWRFPYNVGKFLTNWWKVLGDFFHRGMYGYAKSDTWSFDNYLSDVIPAGLRLLREREIGHPILDDWIEGSDAWDPDTEEYLIEKDDQSILWAAILTAMIDGFEAHNIASEQPWLSEAPVPTFNTKPVEGKDNVVALDTEGDPFYAWLDDNRDRIDTLEDELMQQRNLALSLFSEFYGNLWD